MVREGRQVGYIAEVARGGGVQRVVVRLQKSGGLRRNDRFLPRRDERGKIGFHVVAGMGEPLTDGAEVEAGFAPPRQAAPSSASPITSLANESSLAPPSPSAEPPGPGSGAASWYQGSAQDDLRMLERSGHSAVSVPSWLHDEILAVPQTARTMAPAEAVRFIDERRDALRLHFETAMAEAQKNGDRDTLRELRALRAKTEPMLRRLRAEAARASR